MRWIKSASGAALAALLSAQAVAETSWNLATPYPDGNFHTQNISRFAEDVKGATDGALVITVHANQSLVKHPDIKNSVRRGVVQAGELLVSRLSNEHPIFGADALPFIATSYEDARRLYALTRPVIEERLAAEGLMLLFSVPWPPQGIYAKQEVAKLADLKGVKWRAYNASTERIAVLAGMTPTQIEASDIATAFATGRVDAMITSPSTGADSKAWDFLSHYHDTQAWLPRNMVIVNKTAFDALGDAEQKAVLDAAKAAEERGWAASQKETEAKTKVLADNGITVVAPSDQLKAEFAAIGKTMAEEWVKDYPEGQAVLDKLTH